MKLMGKIWSYLSIFFMGIIAGIVVFVKYLDSAEIQTEITIKKLKTKGNTGTGNNIIPTIILEKDQELEEEEKEKQKKKFSLKNIFRKNKK